MMHRYKYPLIGILLLITLSSCKEGVEGTSILEEIVVSTTPVPITVTLEPTATLPPTPTFTPTVTPIVVLDPDPIEIEIITVDGTVLQGVYYPADANPAPLIVLFHWARGDLEEWGELALWLQNRDQLNRKPDYNHSWKSSSWYPENLREEPIGVLIFTLRECTGGCQNYLPIEWLQDIESAVITASELQGVNKDQILTAGASIGADGAIYACAFLNDNNSGHCLGSFALSPASLLTIPNEDLVGQLINNESPVPVYCLYGLRDDASVETCANIPGITLVDYGYIENHGMELLQPNQNPDPLVLLQEFIQISLTGKIEK